MDPRSCLNCKQYYDRRCHPPDSDYACGGHVRADTASMRLLDGEHKILQRIRDRGSAQTVTGFDVCKAQRKATVAADFNSARKLAERLYDLWRNASVTGKHEARWFDLSAGDQDRWIKVAEGAASEE